MTLVPTLAHAIALVLLLLAVLRYRRHKPPRPLLIGAFAACAAMIFPLASATVGAKRIDSLLTGGAEAYHSGETAVEHSHGGTGLSSSYIFVLRFSGFLGSFGILLIAIGFLALLRRIIRAQDGPHFPTPEP